MELRTLRYFLAVANEGNMTRAADILHVTQPTLSRQMSDLEKELGTILIIRGKRALTLTDDGILLKQRAEDIVEMADRAEREFAGKKDRVSGMITLGASEAMGSRVLAEYMMQFTARYPHVQFTLHNAMADQIKEQIDKGILDIGLVLEPIDMVKYEYIRLSPKETWGVLVPVEHPFAQREQVRAEELADQPLFLPTRPNVRREILSWIGCEERNLNILVSYNLLSNIALLVESGMGIAVCLDGALSLRNSTKLRFVPLAPERTTRSALIWKKNHVFNAATSLFIQMIHIYRSQSDLL